MKTSTQKDFKVKYEYVPSAQSEARLQRAFEIIFEKIIKTEEYNQINQKYLSMKI
jgi:hypothetical protein